MKRAGKLKIALLGLSCLLSAVVHAAVPQLMNYQGRLTTSAGQPVVDADYRMQFFVYDAPTNGILLWTSGIMMVPVVGGLFTYNLSGVPSSLFDSDTVRYLAFKVGSDPEMTPRERLTSVPYASKAQKADTSGYALSLADAAVTSAKILDGTISFSDMARNGALYGQVMKWNGVAWQNLNDSGGVPSGWIDGGSRLSLSSSTDSVGIGSLTQAAKLDVMGDIRCDNEISSASTVYGVKVLADNTTGIGGAEGINVFSYGTNATFGINAYGEVKAGGLVSGYGGNFRGSNYGTGTAYGVYATGLGGVTSTGGRFASSRRSGTAAQCFGVYASASNTGGENYGIYGLAGNGTTNYAGYFVGNVNVTGTLSKGGGAFRIDHPLTPESKYLQHSFVESPDMMNIYNGNVVLDVTGQAIVSLPGWFDALNREFRYQLTAIGAPGPNLHIASEVANNQFRIAGGAPGMRVSWQVTGVRHDAWAEKNRIQVEVDKSTAEKGKYLHPEAYNLSEVRGIGYERNRGAREADAERSQK